MLRLAFAIRSGTTTASHREATAAAAAAAATRSMGGRVAPNHQRGITNSSSGVAIRTLSTTATSNSLHDLDPFTAKEFALLRKFVFPERTINNIEAARAISSSSCLSHEEHHPDGHFVFDEMDKEWDVLADLTQDLRIPEVVSDQWKAPSDYLLPTGI